MTKELRKLGVQVDERPDGMIIHGLSNGGLSAASQAGERSLEGYGDHRIVMALACAALSAAEPVTIRGAEAANVTYPGFLESLTV
jgi:3-phosphoshikimate 1-carboxyvinyltransferase